MHLLEWFSHKDPDTADIPLPRTKLARVTSHRRRVEDDIEVAFHRALSTEQVDVATDILDMLEAWHTRRVNEGVPERQAGALDLQALRGELAALGKSRVA